MVEGRLRGCTPSFRYGPVGVVEVEEEVVVVVVVAVVEVVLLVAIVVENMGGDSRSVP